MAYGLASHRLRARRPRLHHHRHVFTSDCPAGHARLGLVGLVLAADGLAVIAGALLSTRISLKSDLRYVLAAGYLMQALGVILTVWLPTPLGFALGSLLLGLPFTAITFFAMQEVRRLKPHNVASYTGLLTAVYGLGQVAGPPLAAWLLSRSATVGQGFNLALEIAASSLLLGAVMFVALARMYPKP